MRDITPEHREQLVELLRCAADIAANGDRGSALGIAAFHMELIAVPALRDWGATDSHWVTLLRGVGPVQDAGTGYQICGAGYEWLLLEAAQRVESEEWP